MFEGGSRGDGIKSRVAPGRLAPGRVAPGRLAHGAPKKVEIQET